MFDMYGDSCEKLLEILAVVVVLSPISSVSGEGFLLCYFEGVVSRGCDP